jgi:hypothetical protein
MYLILPSEHLVEEKVCRCCGARYPITDKDMEFYAKVSPVFPKPSPLPPSKEWDSGIPLSEGDTGGVREKWDKIRYLIPPPTLCPDCRQQRRLAYHNEKKLYKRKCDATGKDIISIYSPDKPYIVYHQDYWWSDAWDPTEYGSDFDFGKSFFYQWYDLSLRVPRQALIAKDTENSEYTNFVWKVKDSYLISAASFDENCYYGTRVTKSKNCVDTFLVKESENCYECIEVNNSYHCLYSEILSECRDCTFCQDCIGCQDCFLSVWLRNTMYCIENISYTKEEYFEKKSELEKLGHKKLREIFRSFSLTIPKRSENTINTENSYGNSIRNARNVVNVFDGDQLDNVRYSAFVDDVHDTYDINYGYGETHLQYDSLGTGEKSYRVLFSINVWPDVADMIYCDTCTGCRHCFGCIGLRNASYCILNKQYTKEEYEELVPRIIKHMMKTSLIEGGSHEVTGGSAFEWGEFFPASLSPFGYNETVANEYFPLKREEVVALSLRGTKQSSMSLISGTPGSPRSARDEETSKTFLHWSTFNWSDYESPFPSVEKIIPANKLPDTIEGIPDDILSWAIECEVSKKPFRIIRQELEFYRKHNIPIPRRHPDVRHMDRMKLRNPRKLYERVCDSPRCEENWKMKGVILKEGIDASMSDKDEYIKNLPLSFSERESDPERSSAIAKDDKNAPKNNWDILSWNQGRIKRLRKKMITTYAPERPEIVYCEACYEWEILTWKKVNE